MGDYDIKELYLEYNDAVWSAEHEDLDKTLLSEEVAHALGLCDYMVYEDDLCVGFGDYAMQEL